MTKPRKTQRETIDALLEFSSEHLDETTARAELEASGVDVAAFLTKVRSKVKAAQDEKRLAWLREGREALQRNATVNPSPRYLGMARPELEARLRARPMGGGEAGAFFHKLEELTDDDLRSLLADIEELDETPED